MPKKRYIVIVALVAIFIFWTVFFMARSILRLKSVGQTNQKFCTQDAKLCPDGSSVGRIGPNCEFTACPKTPESSGNINQKACTKEAKLCPDGSAVGRTGPNCEFAPCPTTNNCSNEGEKVRESGAGFPANCCSGLKPMYGNAREDCSSPSIPGDIGVCSNCGNGICEAQNNENKCNCPEDCPVQIDTSGWQTYSGSGFQFEYPKDFGATIWRAFVWPPKATVVSASQDLVKIGCPDIQAGALPLDHSQVTLNGLNFTVYKESEGAAGSTYTTYCYTTEKDQNNYAIEFVMRYTSGCGEGCGPYCGTPQEQVCTNFDRVNEVEKPIEQMVSTFKFIK